MEGPMVALLMPFKPDTLKLDDANFVKYLEVGLNFVLSLALSVCKPVSLT